MKYLALILVLYTCKEQTMTFTLQGSKTGDIGVTRWRQISGDTSQIQDINNPGSAVIIQKKATVYFYEITGKSSKDSIYKDTVKITIIK